MTVKIDIISGFLGAGKTTFINKFIEVLGNTEKLAIIENEYGKVNIDGDILRKGEIRVKDITAGCICCSLAGDLDKALEEIYYDYKPDRIIIEPTGIGKLSEIMEACKKTSVSEFLQINSLITMVNVMKFEVLNLSFGDFFHNQIQNADTIVLSRVERAGEEKVDEVAAQLRKLNSHAEIITTPWENIDIKNLMHDRHKEEHIEHGHSCKCGCNGAAHEEQSHTGLETWGVETIKVFDKNELIDTLKSVDKFGKIVRAKGYVDLHTNQWMKFDYVQGELNYSFETEERACKVSFIGNDLDVEVLSAFFK
jgi:G3E family GTPase